MGGKASHGGHGETESKSTNGSEGVDHLPASDTAGRNADGTFTKVGLDAVTGKYLC